MIHRVLLSILLGIAVQAVAAKDFKLLNVSYDPTRELYSEVNAAFSQQWQAKTGDKVTIVQSHGGSGNRPGVSWMACRPT